MKVTVTVKVGLLTVRLFSTIEALIAIENVLEVAMV